MISIRKATANWATWADKRKLKSLIRNKRISPMEKKIFRLELKKRK